MRLDRRQDVDEDVTGKTSVGSLTTALRFGHWFGTDPQFWINLQAQFDLANADKETGETIKRLPTKASLPPQSDQPRLV